MTLGEIRVACFEQAQRMRVPRVPVEDRAKEFMRYVGDDPIKLGCLRVAVNDLGTSARASAEAIIDRAIKYHQIVSPRAPMPTASEAKQESRGGRRKK